jgi:aryl-alcohol dehydrogenase-like predicted oxidoreductase
MKLALGTVQFGLPYGVSNRRGQVSNDEASRILTSAKMAGIDWLDTAAAYGSSETVLGSLRASFPQFRLCTKTMPIAATYIDDDILNTVRNEINASLTRLSCSSVDLLMVHHAQNLLLPGGERLYAMLESCKVHGMTAAIGFSAYDAEEVERVLEQFCFDAVQMPASVIDQRVLTSGLAARLKAQGLQLFLRSVFLQGVLLADVEPFAQHPAITRFREFAAHHALSPLQAALGFVKHADLADAHALVGVTTAAELDEITAAFETAPQLDYRQLASNDADLIDPRRWPKPSRENPS